MSQLEFLNKAIYSYQNKTIRRHLYNAESTSSSAFRLVSDSSNDPNAPDNLQFFFQNTSRNGKLYTFSKGKWYFVDAHVEVGTQGPNGTFEIPAANSLEVWSDDEDDDKIPTIAAPRKVTSVNWQSGPLGVAGVPDDVYGQSAVYNVRENAIYIFGGISAGKVLNSILKFNPDTKTTQQVGELPVGGRLFNLTSDGEFIYIIGGGSEKAPLNKIFRFNTTNNQVTTIAEDIQIDAGAFNDNDNSFYLISIGGPLRRFKDGQTTELTTPTVFSGHANYSKLYFDRTTNSLYYAVEGETSLLKYDCSSNVWSRNLLEGKFGSTEYINLQSYFSFSNY